MIGSRFYILKKALRYSLEYDACVVAIVTNAAEYRIISSINKCLHIPFTRVQEEDREYLLQINEFVADFNIYQFFNDDEETSFYIIANKSEEGYLLKEHKEIDYFLIAYGDRDRIKIEEKLKALKQLSIFQMIFEMDVAKIKHKEKLILE